MVHISQIILVMFLWSICFPLITLGIDYAPHLTFATLRAILAGIALLFMAALLGRSMPKNLRTWGLLSLIGFGATTLGFLGMFHAAEFVSPGIATVIANIQPLLAAMLAYFFLQERLSAWGKWGLFSGFAGIILIALPKFTSSGADEFSIGTAYIILAVLGITISNVLIKKLAGTVDALIAMGWQLVLGSIPLAIIAWSMEDPMSIKWSFPFLFSLLSLSLFGTALVYWLWCTVLAKVELNRANVFSFLVPIFGLGMGVSFYEEKLSWPIIVGTGLTLFGIVLVNRRQTMKHASKP
ncbi:MAG: DMT family transporter [Rhodospirillaceae bacterium]